LYCALRITKKWLSSRASFSLPKIIWIRQYDTLVIEGTELSIDKLGEAYFYWIRQANLLWKEKLTLGCPNTSLSEFDIQNVKDCWNELPEYDNFIDSLRNENENKYCLSRFFASRGFFNSELNQWDQRKLRIWMMDASKFVDHLACLIHLSAGQPSRATELCSYQIINAYNQPRGVFLLKGHVLLSQNYHKSLSMTNLHKNIQRLLPLCLSKLLIQYLVFIRPFEM
jgi:hypothetical protein